MTKLLLTAFALGLASLDFTGTLLALGALGAEAKDRALLAFGCVSILGTAAFGTTLSLVIGPRIAGIDWGALLPNDPAEDLKAAIVEVLLERLEKRLVLSLRSAPSTFSDRRSAFWPRAEG